MNIKQFLPWQAKLTAKILLRQLPVGYRFWQQLNLFAFGDMQRPEYALSVFARHFERASFTNKGGGFTVLEIGPGDTLFSALIAYAYGSAQCYLLDVDRFARPDLAPYRAMSAELSKRGLPAPDIAGAESLDSLLAICNSHYLVDGVHSLKQLPDQSVDFIYSQAVLEHIRLCNFQGMMNETRRVLRPGGICSHRIDLTDHLGGALNNLRFSAGLWESEFMYRYGTYTNRIRYTEMLKCFEKAGFEIEVCGIDRWQTLPTPRKKFAAEFRSLPESDLLIQGFDVVLRPR